MDFKKFFSQDLHKNFVKSFHKQKKCILSGVGNNTSKVFFLSKLINSLSKNQNILWVAQNSEEAQEINKYIQSFTSISSTLFLQNSQKEKNNSIQEVEVVHKLNQVTKHSNLIIISLNEANLKVLPYSEIQKQSFQIIKNQKFDLVELFNKIIDLGYSYSKEQHLKKGEYCKTGDILNIFPLNSEYPIKIEINFDKIENIWTYNSIQNNQIIQHFDKFKIYPINCQESGTQKLIHTLNENNLLILDEVDEIDENLENQLKNSSTKQIIFTSFPREVDNYTHLRYLSVLKFYNLLDFLNDLKDKLSRNWEIIILLKQPEELQNILKAENISFTDKLKQKTPVKLLQLQEKIIIPSSFQNPEKNIIFITDKELYNLKKKSKNKNIDTLQMEILTSLKEGDFVVHFDHGIGKFIGIKQIEVDQNKKEYLEINYLEGDKLFVPIDQADKVSRFIGGGGNEVEPRLSRLGGTDWKNVTRKIKKETQKIAKELLKLYAKRAQAKGISFNKDNKNQEKFEETFPYEETPGQIKAIHDTKNDMEKKSPMDRLVCGDVGFGKTEVALRAAFKATQSHKQVALISPITIFQSFTFFNIFSSKLHSLPE